MSTRTAALALEVTSDVTRATAGLADVSTAAGRAGDDVAQMGRDAQEAARKLTVTADSADELGGKAGKATGALGALSSGFELVGAEKYAGALQGAAMATDFFSGVGDSLNLVMQSTILTNLRAKAATVASTAATIAATVATTAQTAAQWALNVAMNANPVALIVIGVVALVAALVLAYKKSETFRNIVDAIGRAGKAAIGFVVEKVVELVGWVRDRLPGAFNTAKAIITTAVAVYTLPIRTLIGVVRDLIGWVRDKLPGAFQTLKDKAGQIGDTLLKPFQSLWDLIQNIIDLIKKIKLPSLPERGGGIPFIPGIRTTGDGVTVASSTPSTVVNITVTGAVDPVASARQIRDLLRGEARRTGVVVL